MTEQTPRDKPITIGRIVHYCMSELDCTDVKHQRLLNGQTKNSGVVGNEPHPGSVYPAIAVAVLSTSGANLQVFLDGPDVYWALYRLIDESAWVDPTPGSWRWPTITEL